jgi:hypothetical protein
MRFHLIGVPGRVVRLAPRPIVRLPAGFLDLNRDARPAKLCLRPAPRGCAALGSGFSRSFEAVFPGVLFPGVLRRGGAIPWLLRARVARRVDDSSSKLEYSVKKRDTNSYKKEVVHQKKQNMRNNFETFNEESRNRSKTLGHRTPGSRFSGAHLSPRPRASTGAHLNIPDTSEQRLTVSHWQRTRAARANKGSRVARQR